MQPLHCWSKKMETKIVYFVVSGKEEQAEFSADALSEDIKGI